jgi:hypothetical protein
MGQRNQETKTKSDQNKKTITIKEPRREDTVETKSSKKKPREEKGDAIKRRIGQGRAGAGSGR